MGSGEVEQEACANVECVVRGLLTVMFCCWASLSLVLDRRRMRCRSIRSAFWPMICNAGRAVHNSQRRLPRSGQGNAAGGRVKQGRRRCRMRHVHIKPTSSYCCPSAAMPATATMASWSISASSSCWKAKK